MGAVLVIQDPDLHVGSNINSSRLFNITPDEVAKHSGSAGVSHVNAYSHWMGVMFDNHIYDFAAQMGTKMYTPQVRAGEMYVFSSGRIHETFYLVGNVSRITAALFMVWDDKDDAVYIFC